MKLLNIPSNAFLSWGTKQRFVVAKRLRYDAKNLIFLHLENMSAIIEIFFLLNWERYLLFS